MDYSKRIFGKNLSELNYQDIKDFFQEEKEETLYLEFKSFPTEGSYKDKEAGVMRNICGLLNSEGGIIIWGAPQETKDENGNTKASGELTPFNKNLDRDKLINKISSFIIPMPLKVEAIFLSENHSENSIVIIQVPKSIERPHQFKDKYYIRLDGQTKTAPHYLIRALMRSRDYPIVWGQIKLKKIQQTTTHLVLCFRSVFYNTSKLDNEKNFFYRMICPQGVIKIGNQQGQDLEMDFPLLLNGRPISDNFKIYIPASNRDKRIDILLSFGGEKSPAKISSYSYQFNQDVFIENVRDENIYLTEKEENILPSEASDDSDIEKVNKILNY